LIFYTTTISIYKHPQASMMYTLHNSLTLTPDLTETQAKYLTAFLKIRHTVYDASIASQCADPYRTAVGLPIGECEYGNYGRTTGASNGTYGNNYNGKAAQYFSGDFAQYKRYVLDNTRYGRQTDHSYNTLCAGKPSMLCPWFVSSKTSYRKVGGMGSGDVNTSPLPIPQEPMLSVATTSDIDLSDMSTGVDIDIESWADQQVELDDAFEPVDDIRPEEAFTSYVLNLNRKTIDMCVAQKWLEYINAHFLSRWNIKLGGALTYHGVVNIGKTCLTDDGKLYIEADSDYRLPAKSSVKEY
jgi:hypothetical protein